MTLKNGFGMLVSQPVWKQFSPWRRFFIPWRKVEQGLFSNRNIGAICLNIYFLLSTSSSGLAVRMSCRFIYFHKFNCTDLGLQLGDPASGIWHLASGIWHLASGIWHLASGTTHWFVAVSLLIFYIFFGTYPGGEGNRINRRGSEPCSKLSPEGGGLRIWNRWGC